MSNFDANVCFERGAVAVRQKSTTHSAAYFCATVVCLSVATSPVMAEGPDSASLQERGWHLLGVEAGLSYSDLSGEQIDWLGGANLPENLDTFGISVALNFASGNLGPDQHRWILSPFFYWAMDGENTIAGFSTDSFGGRFEHYELGLRMEQERYINPSFSWVWGGSLSYVNMDHTISNGTTYAIRPQDGWRAGLHLGLNTRLADNWVMTSRLGYSFMSVNEQSNCVAAIGAGCTTTTTGAADEDTEMDGFDLSIGLRYEF
jgi:hypothetical protein